MKPTPKPRAIRPMKMWTPQVGALSFGKIALNFKQLDADRPALVIDLSPESVEALKEKVIKATLDEYARPNSTMHDVAARVLSAIGIKPARVAKRKKAK